MREKIAEVMLNTVWKSSEDYHTCMLRVADTILSLPVDEVITLGDLVRMWQSGDLSIKTEIPKDGRYYGDEYKPSTERG